MRFSVVVVVAAVAAAACHHASPPAGPGVVKSSWVAPPMLDLVPADTPYVIATLEPMAPALRTRFWADARRRIDKLLVEHPDFESSATGKLLHVLRDDVLGETPDGAARAGLDPGGRFVIYGLSVWPVTRVLASDPVRARDAIGKIIAAAGGFETASFQGHAYWRRPVEKLVLVIAVTDRDVAVTIVPRDQLDHALPYVLGTAHLAHSLATAPLIPDVLARHQLSGFMFGYADLAHLYELVTAGGHGELDALAASVVQPITAQCHDDGRRLVDLAPRIAFGYRRYDERGFEGRLIVESPPRVTRPLAKLRTQMPALTLRSKPIMSFGAAVDIDGLLQWMRDIATAVHDQPFRCPELAKLDEAAAELRSDLDKPLPPMFHGLRGAEIEVDDLSKNPRGGTGHVTIAGDHVGSLVAQAAHALPMFASLPLHTDGAPVALPLESLGVAWLMPAHLAMHEDRAVLAVGRDSAARAAAQLAAPSVRGALLTFVYDVARFEEKMGPLLDDAGERINTMGLGSVTMALDVDDTGIVLDMSATWAHPHAP